MQRILNEKKNTDRKMIENLFLKKNNDQKKKVWSGIIFTAKNYYPSPAAFYGIYNIDQIYIPVGYIKGTLYYTKHLR